jgi:hypothetical protein
MDLLENLQDSVMHLTQKYRSKFVDVFYVSALSGDGIDTLFVGVAEVVHLDRPSDVGETNQPQFLIDDDGKKCC